MLWIFYTVGYGLPSVIVLLSVLIVETSGIHGYGSGERYILKLVWITLLLSWVHMIGDYKFVAVVAVALVVAIVHV